MVVRLSSSHDSCRVTSKGSSNPLNLCSVSSVDEEIVEEEEEETDDEEAQEDTKDKDDDMILHHESRAMTSSNKQHLEPYLDEKKMEEDEDVNCHHNQKENENESHNKDNRYNNSSRGNSLDKQHHDEEHSDEDSEYSDLLGDTELSWRSPKQISHSDWTIIVVVKGSNITMQKYHVHKSTLAVGPKRSYYFAQAFQNAADDTLLLNNDADPLLLDDSLPEGSSPNDHRSSNMSPSGGHALLATSTTCSSVNSTTDGIEFYDFVREALSAASSPCTSQQQEEQEQQEHQSRQAQSPSPPGFGGGATGDAVPVSPTLIDNVGQEQQTTRLELEQLAAENFPFLLDYLYSPYHELKINTYNATALHSLSAQLQMRALRRKVREFWMADLGMDNLVTYYDHARLFKDAKILAHAEQHCAQHIFDISESAVVNVLTAIDPNFFLRVVTLCSERQLQEDAERRQQEQQQHDKKNGKMTTGGDPKHSSSMIRIQSTNNKGNLLDMDDRGVEERDILEDDEDDEDREKPLRLSVLVAVYSGIHKNELNPSIFNRLTSKEHIPEMECKAAKFLLELEMEIDSSNAGKLTTLKRRAIPVLAKRWEESCFVPNHELYRHSSGGAEARRAARMSESNQSVTSDDDDEEEEDEEYNEDEHNKKCLDLPRLHGEALELFVGQVLIEAKKTNGKLATDLDLLYQWKAEIEAATLMEDFLRSDLKETREELEVLKIAQHKQVELVQMQMQAQINALHKEKQDLIQKQEREIQRIREESQKELKVLGEQYEQDSLDLRNELASFRTKTLQLTSDISECRREQSLKRDRLKLAKLAQHYRSVLIKPNETGPSNPS